MKFSLFSGLATSGVWAACLATASSLMSAPAPVSVDGFTHLRSSGDIAEYRLEANGLTVLLLEDHSAPVVTFLVTYLVGSRNEVTGTTGATHLLEHLMFKGTPNYNREKGNNVDQLLERTGANYNATTWLDRTNYYAELGSEHLEMVIGMEADRMRHLWLRDSDRQPEMTVVRNEFERGENNPIQALYKELFAAAYVAHPYHHSTIGWRSDIENVPIEKLKEFYDTFYWPNNATVSVIGDFAPATALALIKQYYGPIPRSPHPIPQLYTTEPEQTGPRRVIVKRSGQLGVVGLAYKIPPARHADYAALTLLTTILGDGKNSRLYRALTDQNLTTGQSVNPGFNADPTLLFAFAPLAPGVAHADAEKALLDAIEKLKTEGVTPLELETAINKTLADSAYQRDGSFSVAAQLNECIAAGDWTLYYSLEEAVRTVTTADIQRVARTYLVEDQSTTGWFIPKLPAQSPTAATPSRPAAGTVVAAAPAGGAASARASSALPPASAPARSLIPTADAALGTYFYRDPATPRDDQPALPADGTAPDLAHLPDTGRSLPLPGPLSAAAGDTAGGPTHLGSRSTTQARVSASAIRQRIAGLDLILVPTGVKEVVTLTGSLPAGSATSPASNPAIAMLAGGMLDKGTATRDKFALSSELEQVGASISFGTGTDTLGINAKCLRKDLPLVITLLAEQLRAPAFAPHEFEKLKKQLAGSLQRSLENVDGRAAEAFNQTVYPPGHPNRLASVAELLRGLEAATLEEVQAFHAARYGPAHLTLVAVGDLDAVAVQKQIHDAFAGWTGGTPIATAPAPASAAALTPTKTVFMPDKPSVSIVLGQPTGLRYSDPDALALRVGTMILGTGFTGRLMATVRDQEGLTYGIGSTVANDTFRDGDWKITATFSPAMLDQGLTSTRRQLDLWFREGVTADELAKRQENIIGLYKVGLSTTNGLAGTILTTVQRGYGLEWIDQYPDLVRSLTLTQVNTALRQHLDPAKMTLIQAGTVPGVTDTASPPAPAPAPAP